MLPFIAVGFIDSYVYPVGTREKVLVDWVANVSTRLSISFKTIDCVNAVFVKICSSDNE